MIKTFSIELAKIKKLDVNNQPIADALGARIEAIYTAAPAATAGFHLVAVHEATKAADGAPANGPATHIVLYFQN